MAKVTLNDIAHSYNGPSDNPDDYALKKLDLVWRDGGAYALLGPSGCGKTTLLNIISGLLIPTRGQVLFNDQDVTKLPTEQRNIAQIFQFPVIYDTMTVFENLAFPLKNQGRTKEEIEPRVIELAGMLGLSRNLYTKAQHLTADAKQKISLGRGLIRKSVNAILFDEPLTVIDPQLKWELRSQLKYLHKQFRFTMIYVTHDQTEALTFADEVIVMYEGKIVQVGTPEALFERPEHTFVGYFIGSPGMNFLPCRLTADGAEVAGQRIPLAAGLMAKAGDAAVLEIGVRPEAIRMTAGNGSGLAVQVRDVEDMGTRKIATCRLGDYQLKVKVPAGQPVPTGGCTIEFNPAMTRLYADGRLVG